MKPRWTKWLKLALPGSAVLQITACLGSDPEYYLGTVFADALVFNIVSTLFDLLVSGLTTTTALLAG